MFLKSSVSLKQEIKYDRIIDFIRILYTVVDESEAQEAYEFAAEYMGKEVINDAIIRCLSSHQLAECLAFIFRMYDFTEWEERNGEELA